MPRRLTTQERLWRSVPEREVLKAVMDYFQVRGGFCWRANTGSVVSEYRGKTRFIQFGEKGQPDVIGVLNGLLCCFETKRETGKQSDEQRDWQETIERYGGVYRICRPSNWQQEVDAAVVLAERRQEDGSE